MSTQTSLTHNTEDNQSVFRVNLFTFFLNNKNGEVFSTRFISWTNLLDSPLDKQNAYFYFYLMTKSYIHLEEYPSIDIQVCVRVR